MSKQKRLPKLSLSEKLLQASAFNHSVFSKPRDITRHMTSIVRYPKLINDIGRTVDVRRIDDNRYAFELRQKRYLGRGTYSISARAKGIIRYDPATQQTSLSGHVQLGGQYMVLLSIMTAFVLISSGIVFVTILFLPLTLLMLAVLSVHWVYLKADQRDLLEQIDYLLDLTERELRLQESGSSHHLPLEQKQANASLSPSL